MSDWYCIKTYYSLSYYAKLIYVVCFRSHLIISTTLAPANTALHQLFGCQFFTTFYLLVKIGAGTYRLYSWTVSKPRSRCLLLHLLLNALLRDIMNNMTKCTFSCLSKKIGHISFHMSKKHGNNSDEWGNNKLWQGSANERHYDCQNHNKIPHKKIRLSLLVLYVSRYVLPYSANEKFAKATNKLFKDNFYREHDGSKATAHCLIWQESEIKVNNNSCPGKNVSQSFFHTYF